MRFHVDRALPVPLATQLTGQIEYAVACGDLRPGERLPPMRELAEALGISPVTVAGVYRTLQGKGLVVSRVGDGTYVTEGPSLPASRVAREEAVKRAVDQLLRVAQHHGLDVAELVHRVQVRHAWHDRRAVRLLFVATFAEATRSYAHHAAAALGPGDTVDATTISDLRAGTPPAPLAAYDAILTIGYRLATVEELAQGAAPVAAVPFLPSEETRTRLAQLQPGDNVVAVATFAQYMGALKSSIERFAPHVLVTAVETAETLATEHLIGRYDAIVYATGSEGIVPHLPRAIPTIEYRHVPEGRAVAQVVREVLAGRAGGGKPGSPGSDEPGRDEADAPSAEGVAAA